MGIYDRDYYRNDGPSFLGSITGTPVVCKWLIIINVAVFILQMVDMRGAFGPPGWFTLRFSLITGQPGGAAAPERHPEVVLPEDLADFVPRVQGKTPWTVTEGGVWRLVTYAFLHGGLWHILFNMLFLWWFGSDLEQMYGSREFLAFYLISATLGGIAYVLADLTGLGNYAMCIGASGAVSAVMVLFALHFPRHTILLFFVIPVPIWILVVLMVAKDFLHFVGGTQTGVAVTVHLAGAAFGYVYWKSQIRLLNFVPDLSAWRAQRSRPKLRVYREEEPVAAPAPRSSTPDMDEHFEAKLDAVLEKVGKHGQSSLTDHEREILRRASELYKRKRS